MTSKDSHGSPFPPPVAENDEEQEQSVAPANPDEFMHGVLDELGFQYVSAEPMLENIEPYAHGGTGEIFTAQDGTLGRTVAVKTLRPKHQYSIDQIERLVRGLNSCPGAYTFMNGKMLKIWGSEVTGREAQGEAGTVAGTDKKSIFVNCGEGVLALSEVQYEGKKRMSTQAFLLGAKVEPGQRLTAER